MEGILSEGLGNFIINKKRRGVAPIIASLLLVAITVIGGSMIMIFSQESFNESQLSGYPAVEFIEILGYDARDAEKLELHDGRKILEKDCCGISDGKKSKDERITIFLQNNSVDTLGISQLRFAGETYYFTETPKFGHWSKIGGGHKPHPGEYVIISSFDGDKKYEILDGCCPKIKPGEQVTILLDLKDSISFGRDAQFKLTTGNGNDFVYTIVIGQNKV